MVGERAREHCPILPSENSSAPSCRQKATLGSQRATLRTIPHIDVWGFCFSLVSTPPSLLLLVAPHHHLSLTNQLSSTALSSTKCHQPKMSPTNCHQPIATHQVSSTNCHHLSTTNFSRTNQLSPTNHQPIVINQLSPTNCHQPMICLPLVFSRGSDVRPGGWLLGLHRCSAVICVRGALCFTGFRGRSATYNLDSGEMQKPWVLQGWCR